MAATNLTTRLNSLIRQIQTKERQLQDYEGWVESQEQYPHGHHYIQSPIIQFRNEINALKRQLGATLAMYNGGYDPNLSSLIGEYAQGNGLRRRRYRGRGVRRRRDARGRFI